MRHFRRHADALTERGMRVNGFANIYGISAHLYGECDLTNHVARALMELSISGVPLGFGVLTCENEGQARVRADRKQKNKGAEVVSAVLRMVGLSYRFNKLSEVGE